MLNTKSVLDSTKGILTRMGEAAKMLGRGVIQTFKNGWGVLYRGMLGTCTASAVIMASAGVAGYEIGTAREEQYRLEHGKDDPAGPGKTNAWVYGGVVSAFPLAVLMAGRVGGALPSTALLEMVCTATSAVCLAGYIVVTGKVETAKEAETLLLKNGFFQSIWTVVRTELGMPSLGEVEDACLKELRKRDHLLHQRRVAARAAAARDAAEAAAQGEQIVDLSGTAPSMA